MCLFLFKKLLKKTTIVVTWIPVYQNMYYCVTREIPISKAVLRWHKRHNICQLDKVFEANIIIMWVKRQQNVTNIYIDCVKFMWDTNVCGCWICELFLKKVIINCISCSVAPFQRQQGLLKRNRLFTLQGRLHLAS